jgi:hypothetical protein
VGQYFTPVILDTQDRITRAVAPRDYGSGDKLAGHTRADAPFMTAVETMLALDGGARLVWAGDEHDSHPHQPSLYHLVEPQHFVRFAGLVDLEEAITPNAERPIIVTTASHPYICNADKGEYIDKHRLLIDDYGNRRTPLPALTAESGWASNRLVGSWARDRIYLSVNHPGDGWTQVPNLIWT